MCGGVHEGCVGGIRLDMWRVEGVHGETCMGVVMRHMGYRGDVEVWRGNMRDGCGVLASNW